VLRELGFTEELGYKRDSETSRGVHGSADVLKLRSDQTDIASVDLHQQRSNGEGRLLSFGHTCVRLRSQKIKPPFTNPETPAAVGHNQPYVALRQFAPKRSQPIEPICCAAMYPVSCFGGYVA
jgi:hypothetical protein